MLGERDLKWSLQVASGFVGLGAVLMGALPSSAAPLYVGYSYNGGAIVDKSDEHDWDANQCDQTPLVSLAAVSRHSVWRRLQFRLSQICLAKHWTCLPTGGTGQLMIYVTETNMAGAAINVPGFLSTFTSNCLAIGLVSYGSHLRQ